MHARTFALVDADAFGRDSLLRALHRYDISALGFPDAHELMLHPQAIGHAGYVLELAPSGSATIELIRLLRRQTGVAVMVMSEGRSPDTIQEAIDAGAALHFTKSIGAILLASSVAMVLRELTSQARVTPWKLDRAARQLVAPDRVRIDLSVDEQAMLACFLASAGHVVSREALCARLQIAAKPGRPDEIHAAIARLQRRSARVTPITLPFQVRARTGYAFHAQLDEI